MDPIKPANPSYDIVTRYGPTWQTGFTPVYYQRLRSRLTVQAKPFNKVSTFSVNTQKVIRAETDPEYGSYASISDGADPGEYLREVAYNKAYAELMDNVNSSQSQLAATLAEAHKTADTLNKRAEWLYGHFSKRVKRRKKRFGRSSSVASIFIEYRWVYEATIGDIVTALRFLQQWEPTTFVRGRGKAMDRKLYVSNLSGIKPGKQWDLRVEEASCRLQAHCKIDNPNLFWASQMGLTNPPALAWELTKFSWLADWFGTLGEVINAWDDRLGLQFQNPCQAVKRSMVRDNKIHVWFQPRNRWAYTQSVVSRELYERDQTLGSGPFLLLRQIKGPSLVRGATAIALLTQLLGR